MTRRNEMPDAVIFGAGGLGRDVVDICDAAKMAGDTDLNLIGFIDEDTSLHGQVMLDRPIFGGLDWLRERSGTDVQVLFAIGSPATRRKLKLVIEDIGVEFGSIRHPTSTSTPYVTTGRGVIVAPGATLMSGSNLGDFTYVNVHAIVGHDVVLEEYTNIGPGVTLSGGIRIREGADIGAGASIIQYVEIGEWSVVAAGAAVVKDVPANTLVAGVPAVIKRQNPVGWHQS
jgi:sugar O-acyltransferase (sialic acid O-acetyltransferase NeuD family)